MADKLELESGVDVLLLETGDALLLEAIPVVADLDDTMAALVCGIDERKIYNDIRSQIDITVTTVIIDDPLAEEITKTGKVVKTFWNVEPAETRSSIAITPTIRQPVSWGNVWAQGRPFGDEGNLVSMSVATSDPTDSSIIVEVTNGAVLMTSIEVHAEYLYTEITGYIPQSHEEQGIETLTVRTTDATSIAAFGRRVMNLTWPLGQTQVQMESLIDHYLALYKDPLPYLNMTVLGSTNALILIIFTLKISDRVTIVSSRLGINQDFFIDSVSVSHNTHGLLVGEFAISEIPSSQDTTLFTLDTSELDGTHTLG